MTESEWPISIYLPPADFTTVCQPMDLPVIGSPHSKIFGAIISPVRRTGGGANSDVDRDYVAA